MTKFEDNIRRAGSHISLSDTERARMKEQVSEYMRYTPVREAPRSQPTPVRVFSLRLTASFVVLAVLFTSGVGVSYASNDALPGEPLFVVKEMKEEVRAQLTLDSSARAQWEVERAHRRLEEVETLALRGALDADTEAIVTQKYEERLVRAQTEIDALESEQPERAEALRIALSVGSEARVEVLEESTDDSDSSDDDERTVRDTARARIARAVRSTLPEWQGSVALARAERIEPQRAFMALGTSVKTDDEDVADESGDGAMSSTTLMMAVAVADPVPAEHARAQATPRVAAELMRVLSQQEAQFKTRLSQVDDAQRHEQIERVLTHIDDTRESIKEDIEHGDYERARERIAVLLRTIHKARAAFEAQRDVTSAVIEEADEEGSDEVSDDMLRERQLREIPDELRIKIDSRIRSDL